MGEPGPGCVIKRMLDSGDIDRAEAELVWLAIVAGTAFPPV